MLIYFPFLFFFFWNSLRLLNILHSGYFGHPPSDPHWGETLQLWGVWALVPHAGHISDPPADAYRRSSLQVPRLWKSVCCSVQPCGALENSHGGEAVHVHGVRETVRQQVGLCSAHQDASGGRLWQEESHQARDSGPPRPLIKFLTLLWLAVFGWLFKRSPCAKILIYFKKFPSFSLVAITYMSFWDFPNCFKFVHLRFLVINCKILILIWNKTQLF